MARSRLPNRPRFRMMWARSDDEESSWSVCSIKGKNCWRIGCRGSSRSGSESGALAQLERRWKVGEGKGHVQALFTRSNTLWWGGYGHTHCRKCVSNCTIILTLERGHWHWLTSSATPFKQGLLLTWYPWIDLFSKPCLHEVFISAYDLVQLIVKAYSP